MSTHPDLEQTRDSIEAARKRSMHRALNEAGARSFRPPPSTGHDLLHQLDWIRDGWNDDEHEVTRRLQRLERSVRTLLAPDDQDRALELYGQLCRARLSVSTDWRDPLARLGLLASRAALRKDLVCGFDYGRVRCQVKFASESARTEHRDRVHGVTEGGKE